MQQCCITRNNLQQSHITIIIVLKCFAYVLLFDFDNFQISVNELFTSKVRFPPAPISDFLEEYFFIKIKNSWIKLVISYVFSQTILYFFEN